jgi:hypothetical protein
MSAPHAEIVVSDDRHMNPIRSRLPLIALLGLAFTQMGCRPPAAELKEAYSPGRGGVKGVDHALLDEVLGEFVSEKGLVDYKKLHGNRKGLDAYTDALKKVEFEPLGRDEKLALLINAYNAFTLTLILDNWPLDSINDIPKASRFEARRFRIGSLELSLNDIENKYLRSKFKEPRIHFAVNCASIGCPLLRNEAYRAKNIDAQLQEQARLMHNNKTWFDLDAENSVLKLTKLYEWFAGDFEQVSETILDHAAKFNEELAGLLKAGKRPTVEFLDYDWALNKQQR